MKDDFVEDPTLEPRLRELSSFMDLVCLMADIGPTTMNWTDTLVVIDEQQQGVKGQKPVKRKLTRRPQDP